MREALGEPESSDTRSDGVRVDTYRIRQRVKSIWEGWRGKSIDGPLGASEEELQRLQEIARGKDEGCISKGAALGCEDDSVEGAV